MKTLFLVATLSIAIIGVACSGDSDNQAAQQEDSNSGQQGPTLTTQSGSSAFAAYGDTGNNGLGFLGTAQTASALPGITVVGYAESKAAPDSAIIRLTVGSSMEPLSFGSSGPQLELIAEEDLEPVVKALNDAGVSSDDISLNTFAPSNYGPYGAGAAQITFRWSQPDDISSIVQAAQDAVRRDTQYALQNIGVTFTLTECQPLEEDAQRLALSDARNRAERLAAMADVSLGDITAISEAAGFSYGVSSGCAALEHAASPYYSLDYPVSNSPSEVTITASLQVTFAIR